MEWRRRGAVCRRGDGWGVWASCDRGLGGIQGGTVVMKMMKAVVEYGKRRKRVKFND